MKRVLFQAFSVLLFLPLLFACHEKQAAEMIDASNPDIEKLIKAYESKDWATVVAIGDTLYDEAATSGLARIYAEALAGSGNPQKAIEILNAKLAQYPDDYYLLQTRGDVCTAAGELDSAIASYDKVIALRPTYARPYMYEGEIYELKGDTQKAISRYLGAARLFAANHYAAETAEYSMRILRLDSTNAEALQMLSSVRKAKKTLPKE